MATTLEADQRTELLNAAAVNTWQYKLWVQVNNHWTDTTGDIRWLLTCDGVTGHLYDWAVKTGRIEKADRYPFHRTASAIAPAFHADRQAFEAEAHSYIRSRMTARREELARIEADKQAEEQARQAKLAALEITL